MILDSGKAVGKDGDGPSGTVRQGASEGGASRHDERYDT